MTAANIAALLRGIAAVLELIGKKPQPGPTVTPIPEKPKDPKK